MNPVVKSTFLVIFASLLSSIHSVVTKFVEIEGIKWIQFYLIVTWIALIYCCISRMLMIIWYNFNNKHRYIPIPSASPAISYHEVEITPNVQTSCEQTAIANVCHHIYHI